MGGQAREVNVLDLARTNGQLATTDPLVMKLLQNIQSQGQLGGSMSANSDPLLYDYSFLNPGKQSERQPAIRIDYNLSNNHRLTGTYNHFFEWRAQDHINSADKRWPGAPNYRRVNTTRPSRSVALRSTLTSNLVSEFRVGVTKGERLNFGDGITNGPDSFIDEDGFAIDFDANIGLTNWFTTSTDSARSGYQYTIDETFSWQKGNHSLSFGGGAFLGRTWEDNQQIVPGINLRFDTNNDPAQGIFTPANFPSASSGQLTDARELYAILTGRVGAVTGLATLDPETGLYSYLGNRRREGNLDVYSTFFQDSWRLTPTLTLNAGLRYDVQMPFSAGNDTMSTATLADVCGISGLGDGGMYSSCNFNNPNASGGKLPVFSQLTKGTLGYNVDYNNIAPNIGLAWRPHIETGFFRALLGDPEQATLRGGYSVAYERQGLGVFTGVFGPNPGARSACRAMPAPVWYRRRIVAGVVARTEPALSRSVSNHAELSNPRACEPRRRFERVSSRHPGGLSALVDGWVAARADQGDGARGPLRRTRGVDQWSELDWNADSINIIENGFFDEFKMAQANLRANNTSGDSRRIGSFAYFGPGSGTNPLPIYLAYLNGRRDATNVDAYTGGTSTWSNTTFAQRLVRVYPRPYNAASDFDGNLTRRTNAQNAGLPANFFVVNPNIDEVERHGQRRVQRLPRTPDRGAAAVLQGARLQRQLSIRNGGWLVIPWLPLGPHDDDLHQ